MIPRLLAESYCSSLRGRGWRLSSPVARTDRLSDGVRHPAVRVPLVGCTGKSPGGAEESSDPARIKFFVVGVNLMFDGDDFRANAPTALNG